MTLLDFAKLLGGLLIAFQVKHLLADYFLQTPWMLGKFKPGWDFLGPLAAHCGVHAFATLIIFWLVRADLWLALSLAALDFTLHFLMDRVKASPRMLGRWKPLTAAEMLEAQQVVQAEESYGVCSWERSNARDRLRGNTRFWWSLGFDQFFHHLTHYGLIALYIINAP
jgi:hypothetical protein